MQTLQQRILVAATFLFAVVAVVNSNLPAAILAAACLAAWTVITLRRSPR